MNLKFNRCPVIKRFICHYRSDREISIAPILNLRGVQKCMRPFEWRTQNEKLSRTMRRAKFSSNFTGTSHSWFLSVISVMQSRFFHNTFSEFLFLEVLESPNLFVCFYKCHLNVVEPERLGHALNLSPQLKSHNINISGSQRNAKETR